MTFLNKVRSIKQQISELCKINIIKTILFNYRTLPFSQAIKLPFYFYGPVKFISLKGNVQLNCKVEKGKFKLGYSLEYTQVRNKTAELRLDGTLNVNGEFTIGNDYSIHVLKNAILQFDQGSYLGKNSKIICTNKIITGKGLRLGYDSQISDSNYHYTINLNTNSVKRFNGEIFIGNYCWIGNRCSIMKGSKTPNFLIIASNSILNKNYIPTIPEKSVIGGIPAKLIRENQVRVFNPVLENDITNFFNHNPDIQIYKYKSDNNYF